MTTGVKALRKIQLGRETTPGTAVAATSIWRGLGVLSDDRETVFPEEDVGILGGVDRAYVPKLAASLSMGSVEATYQQILHLLEAGILTATPTADGVGTDFIYEYPFPTTSLPTIKTYTLEGGDNAGAEEMEYAFVQSLTLEGSAGEALMMSADWVGRKVTPSTFTGALSIPAVEDILMSKAKVYVDAVGGTIGTTQLTQTVLSMNLQYNTGLVPVWTADGELYFTMHKNVMPEATLELTFEHNAACIAEKAIWRAGTPRQIQIKWEGSAFGTPGTTYSNHTLILNLAGKWETFGPLDDSDGNDTITATFRARYNSTAALFGKLIVVNELATVP